jgi:hypothetical protein
MGYDLILSPHMIRILYRRLLIAGYTQKEASNLIASLMGLDPADNGWSTNELVHLLHEEYRDKKNTTRP